MTTDAPRRDADAKAVILMLLLTLMWGFNQIAIKLAAPGVSLVMQACLRSAIAAVMVFLWARLVREPLFDRDGTLWPGLAAGLLFAAEFAFIHAGLAHTTASRMIVFVYLAPCLTAFGLAMLVPGERLTRLQWSGVLIAFTGILVAFGERAATDTLLGDFLGVLGALMWALTTILIRATRLSSTRPSKTLFYQVGLAGAILPLVSWVMGEPGIVRLDGVTVASIAYQGVLVAFGSYLAWFWLLTRYRAAQLAVFSFLAPLFGVAFGVLLLGDPISPAFAAAAVLVGAGIALVNLPARTRARATEA
ncbi:MAG: DMT family transporter [Burkholderiales bacterium]|nr:DMT family transporter [Burkholderiales bacterium]